MPNPRIIEVGDIVRVNNNAGQCTLIYKGRVEYIPCATGDSWHFLDLYYDPPQPVYISEGVEIRLLEKADGTKYNHVGWDTTKEDTELPF